MSSPVSTTIKLSCFLDSRSFIRRQRIENLPSEQMFKKQQLYLTAIFQQDKHTPPIALRKMPDGRFEVIDGLCYVDTLLQFFKGGIPLPYVVAKKFIVTDAGIVESKCKSETIRGNAACYESLSNDNRFNSFLNTIDVPVLLFD